MDARVREMVENYCDGEMTQMIVSNSTNPEELKKISIRPILIKNELLFQASEYRGTKVFHENLTKQQLADKAEKWLCGCMHQMEIKSAKADVTVLVSKKGTTTVKCKKHTQSSEKQVNLSHNRKKKYIIEEGMKVPFLVDLGVMTLDGKIVRTRYDKFRQINRFLEFVEDVLPKLPKEREVSILDFGCGKSYLTFAMYYYLHELKGYSVRITGLDLKEDVIAHCNELAASYGYDKLRFLQGDIASYEECQTIDMVVTLHACDTATDYALEKAIAWGAKVILSVPCCQHELNRTIRHEDLNTVFSYGIIRERMAALLTDALRANVLEMAGYRVQILEFIDMEHTPKNLLIRAVKSSELVPAAKKKQKKEAVRNCIEKFGVNPTLYRDLYGDKEET